MTGSNERIRNGRPMSTIALNFSAALDELFSLGAVGELEETVQQKNREVETQKTQLEDLDVKLKQADEKLKKLELKHKRMSRHFVSRPTVQGFFNVNSISDSDDTETSSAGSESSEPGQS